MRRTYWLLLVLAGLMVVILLFALRGRLLEEPGRPATGGAAAIEPLVFSAGGAPSELAAWRELLSQFEELTGIPAVLRELPANSDQQHTYYTTLMGGGEPGIDLMRLDVVWLPEFIAAGWLAPLDSDALDTAGLLPALEQIDAVDGTWYAVAWNIDAGLLYYRSDLLAAAGIARPPATWDELAAAIVQVRGLPEAPPDGFLFQGRQYEGLSCVYLEQVVSRGGSLDPRDELDAAAHLAALSFLRRLIDEGLSPRDTASLLDEERARERFQRGEAVFMRNWPYAWSLLNSPESPVAGKVAIAPLPHGEGGQSAGAMGGWHLAIPASSKQPAQAHRLAAFLTSPEVQLQLARELNWLPTRRSVWEDPALAEQAPDVLALRAAAQSAVPRPALPRYPELSLEVQRLVNAVLSGMMTPEAGWEELEVQLAKFS